MLQALGGLALLGTLYFSALTLRLNRRGQLTERFTKAIEQLGSDSLPVRLGGIYALEQIAFDSAELHWPVVEVLSAYLRAHAQASEERELARNTSVLRRTVDHWTIAMVIGRRRAEHDPEGQTVELGETYIWAVRWKGARLNHAELRGARLQGGDLRYAQMAGADLYKAHLQATNLYEARLEGANLAGAHLEGAILVGTHLEGADMSGAQLQGATLMKAHLTGANLFGARLERANLLGADLEGVTLSYAHLEEADLRTADLARAEFRGAHLKGAFLHGADLTGTDLSHTQLASARVDASTILPTHLYEEEPVDPARPRPE